ncbi:MAG TPA: DUF418 domain-containing protein [Devosia sp.]|nr:DUF418 domain-containing protein [Devosia sp.]
MVFVNFHVVTGGGDGGAWAMLFLSAVEGKAAATFVVLAGVGLALGAQRNQTPSFSILTLKRALFLFVIGLINSLIFPADILHYYAVYFVVGLLLIRRSTRTILIVALVLPLVFVALLFVLDYEAGWDWETFDYAGFWTPSGFARNLLFNGWHPLVPWMSFLLMGFLLARLELGRKKTQNRLMLYGAVALGAAYALSFVLSSDPELAELVTVSPIPPGPLYMLAGAGAASLSIGICLWVFRKGQVNWLTPFTRTGKQALSLYILHIIVGMGTLEGLGMLGGQSAETAIATAGLFIIISVIYAIVWARFFRSGPFEWLMHKLVR